VVAAAAVGARARSLDDRLRRWDAGGCGPYNSVHTYVLPVVLGFVGVLTESSLATKLALIWFTHIGLDRALGYGLKYPTQFKDTHLQRV
jgi:hypothetical protein